MDNKPLIVATLVVGGVALFGLARRAPSDVENASAPPTAPAEADTRTWTVPTVEAAEARVLRGLQITGYFNGYLPMVVSKEHFGQSVSVTEHLFLLAEAARGSRKTDAQYRMGLMHHLGLFQQLVDESGALYWYQIAASRGHAEARGAATHLQAQGIKAPEGNGIGPEG